METMQYLRALGRSWFIVLIALIAGGAGGYFVYHRATPMYRSCVQMVVSGSGDEVTSRVLATQRAQAVAQLAPKPPAVQAAATRAGYANALPGVTASADTDNPFVSVCVQDTDPKRAQAVANSFAGVLPSVMTQYLGPTDTPIKITNISDAGLPASPYSPDKKKDIGLGLAAGLVLGIFVALLREVFNRTVRDSDELEKLTGMTVLGTVPKDLSKRLLPAVSDPRSARAEAYRQVRTTLLNAQSRGLHTIVVTSAALGEGKTSVATNVAAVFSRAGHRVALVDADLRRPRVAAFFGLKPQYGLTEVLSGVTTLPNALTGLDDGRLAVLTSGRIPANPSEALGSVGMERVIAQLSEHYEYVIIDTPPVLPVTDASVLAPKVDGVIVVARMEHTTRDRVKRAIASLERVNATVLGVVPNQAGKGTDRDYRYPYRYTPSRRNKDHGEGPEVGTTSLQQHAPAASAQPAPEQPAPEPPGPAQAAAKPVQPTPAAQPAAQPAPPPPAYVPPPQYSPPSQSTEPPQYAVPSTYTEPPQYTAPSTYTESSTYPAPTQYAPPPQYGAAQHTAQQHDDFSEPVKYEPVKYEPVQYEPVQYEPGQYEPVQYEPGQYEPGRYEPAQYPVQPDPQTYAAQHQHEQRDQQEQQQPVYRAPRQQPLNGASHDEAEASPYPQRRPAHGYDDE